MGYRIERDSMGEIQVPDDKLWGAQTQRSLEHFRIGSEKMPQELVLVTGVIKRAAAEVNKELGVLPPKIADAIIAACDELAAGELAGNFPLASESSKSPASRSRRYSRPMEWSKNHLAQPSSRFPFKLRR